MVDYSLRNALEMEFSEIKKLIHEVGINPTGLDWRRFIVAVRQDGKIVGCGQLKPHFDGTVELASIAVAAAERKQGVGGSIIRRLMENSPRPLYLTCRKRMGAFYQQFGFRVVKNEELSAYFKLLTAIARTLKIFRILNDSPLVMILE